MTEAGKRIIAAANEAQRAILDRADKGGVIYVGDSEICPGIHFCADWDGLAVCAGMPEAEACTCGRITTDADRASDGEQGIGEGAA